MVGYLVALRDFGQHICKMRVRPSIALRFLSSNSKCGFIASIASRLGLSKAGRSPAAAIRARKFGRPTPAIIHHREQATRILLVWLISTDDALGVWHDDSWILVVDLCADLSPRGNRAAIGSTFLFEGKKRSLASGAVKYPFRQIIESFR